MSVGWRSEQAVLEWGSASAAFRGASGDVAVVTGFPGGALVAVIDGLGHGDEAAEAAHAAARILEAAPGDSVLALLERCHEGLRRTRGVVMSLASIDVRGSALEWTGVGNVEAVLVRADPSAQPSRDALTTPGGVVGYQLPRNLRSKRIPVQPGDLLILWTDGVRAVSTNRLTGSAQEIADALLSQHRLESDDALVLVARYLGGTGGTSAARREPVGSGAGRGARHG
jgi:phosphoserine phosphatase RsbX